MISSATSLLLSLVVATAADSASPAMRERVAAAVAVQWSVAAEHVHLEWGRLPPGGLPDSVPVRLSGKGLDGWFVVLAGTDRPRAARVRAGTVIRMPVAARALAAGAVISAEDVAWEDRVSWGPPVDPASLRVESSLVRRALAAGEPLLAPAVSPPPLVKTGEPLRLVWTRGSVTIEQEAVALTPAGLGELVRARGPAGERLRGTMIAPGVARTEGARP